MIAKIYFIAVFLLTVLSVQSQRIVEPVVFGNTSRSCPSSELQQAARRNLSAAILRALPSTSCGGSGWRQVVNVNMSDPSQQCPSSWTLFTSPARSCSLATAPGCQGFSVPVPVGAYTRVCGQAAGYAVSTPDGFITRGPDFSIDLAYLDGIGITYGSPRQHIWSFAAALPAHCPCDSNLGTVNLDITLPPSFVGDNYFCDTRNNGILWDGQGCTTNCCTFNSPPYFTVTLPAPTSSSLEVRLCTDQVRGDEAVHVSLLQLYVQ